MEWRQQTSVSCADAFNESQRWIEEVTGKVFGCNNFRAALENGVLLVDLINQLKPGIIKRVNRLSTPIAGLAVLQWLHTSIIGKIAQSKSRERSIPTIHRGPVNGQDPTGDVGVRDNVTVFLKACGKLGLNESQLFHPGDLQDLSTRVTLRRDESNRRLKNVLITIYWLGRKAQLDAFYNGPQLNFKAFEGLLGLALSKALDEGSNAFVKDGGNRECWYLGKEERQWMTPSIRREDSLDSVDSLDSRALRPNSEGCGSDAEAEQVFRIETSQPSVHKNRGYIPPPLLRRRPGREENGRRFANPLARAYGNQARPERPVQVNPGWIWSKSLSDIPMVYPVRKPPNESTIHDVSQDSSTEGEWNRENTEKSGATAEDSEAHWQDDLKKWKNRRRSSKSDPRRKSQDREHVIHQMTMDVTHSGRTEAPGGGLCRRDQQSPRRNNPAPRLHSTSPSKSSRSDFRPLTRALLARSYTTEAPATLTHTKSAHTRVSSVRAMPASDAIIMGEGIHFSSLASGGAAVTTHPSLDCPFSSQTRVKAQGGTARSQLSSEVARPENVCTDEISTLVATLQPKETTQSASPRDPTAPVSNLRGIPFRTDPKATTSGPDSVDRTAAVALADVRHRNHNSLGESHEMSWEAAVEQGEGQQPAGICKHMSKTGSWSGSASLPRGYRRSEGSARLSSAITARPFGTKQSRMSSLPKLCNVDDNHGELLNGEKEELHPLPSKSLLKRQTAASHLRSQYQASIQQKKVNKAKQNDTEQEQEGKGAALSNRTSFNGYRHQPYTQLIPQPYSNLHSQNYKSSTLPSTKVDHSNMRVSLTLKPNSRPDFGFQTHWDSAGARIKSIQLGSPAELCQLCVEDEIVAVDGVAVAHMHYNQWKDKMTSALQNGSLTMDVRRYGNKDWRTSERSPLNPPDQSRMTLNLTASAPVLIGCPDHRANGTASAETTATKALKLKGQRDDVLQDTVIDAAGLADDHGTFTKNKEYGLIMSENQRRRAEFFKRRGGSESAISDLQVPSLSPSSSSWSWDHEQDRRRQAKWQEEQERLLQEQYHRDQERLDAEWRRARQDATGDLCGKSRRQTTTRVSSPHRDPTSTHKSSDEQSPVEDERKEAAGEEMAEKDWAMDSCGFAQLSPAHRAKSLSTPALAGSVAQARGDQRTRKGQCLPKAEIDRKRILEEMKKRTQLLTDNSWIRQRSTSFFKEPVYVGVPIKRYESLDDLEYLRQSPDSAATLGYPRPESAAAGYYAPSRNSSSRYSTGAILSRSNASVDSPHHSNVWAATDISEELKMKFQSETASRPGSAAFYMTNAVLQITD